MAPFAAMEGTYPQAIKHALTVVAWTALAAMARATQKSRTQILLNETSDWNV